MIKLFMEKIGEGMVSEAFLTGGRVLLTGKRDDAFKIYSKLKTNLDFLDGKIKSLKIPCNAKTIAPCDKYPQGAIEFNYVAGVPLSEKINECTAEQKKAIGGKLAEFITEMQQIKPNPQMHHKAEEIERNLNKLKTALAIIEPYLSDVENAKLIALSKDYADFISTSDFFITHGDLHFENLIVDRVNNFVGIIDFGNTEFYVPEIEFMWMQTTDPNFANDKVIFESMVENYSGKINPKNIKLVRLVGAIRFFKHAVQFYHNMADSQLAFIKNLINEI